MENVLLTELAAKGIWCLIKEAVKALWKGVKKRPPSSSGSSSEMKSRNNKRRNRRGKRGKRFWMIKISFEKN